MRKFKLAAGLVSALALIMAPAIVAGATNNNPQGDKGSLAANTTAAEVPCKRLSAGNGQAKDIFLSTAMPRTYTGTDWQDVQCARTTFRLGYAERALVTSDFNAEADCNGTDPANGQWCETRALLNGLEGSPVAAEPSSFAFDNVSEGPNNWQAHSMNRAWEVRCTSREGCQYKFAVQTKMHDGSVTGMWLDEIATHLSIVVGPGVPL
ncbi:MAG TPA: hypothetical protein VK674_05575 [Candidatus Limnocylindria bacterium]|nr:hypothetical protein [Candidatus Limnocylindria bacterium]